ncbi:pyrimidine reductase family protein [Actinophytocola sp.]|uniref:pyrimidine reductase family protein n=1 Tax=Actinophytocola sp. TaxID=1872138 RepID=UPI003D6AE6DF
MHLLPLGTDAARLSDRELEELYDYPPRLDRPWLQVNFVSSADGAATVAGRSQGLSSPADKKIFALGRDLSDVVLVGAGTATVEGYRGVKHTELRAERRARLGLSAIPPIAVVTGRCSIGPQTPMVADTLVPPIVLTTEAAPKSRRIDLEAAGADVVIAGDELVDLNRALDALAERGLLRVCCEGGPHLFSELIAGGLVDQLCLTIAPLLTGAGAARIAEGMPRPEPLDMELASVLTEDGFLMLRYRRA